jgi:dihydroorotate dehydrogenase
MPDWSYRTILRPALFALPPVTARGLALGVVGTLGRSGAGRAVIDFLGHMRPPASVGVTRLGLAFPSRAGLGCGLDPGLRATAAFARFGCGFVEAGPITLVPRNGGVLACDPAGGCLQLADPPEGIGLDAAVVRLAAASVATVPLLARLDLSDQESARAAAANGAAAIARLAPHVAGFTIAGGRLAWSADEWREAVDAIAGAARVAGRPVLLVVPADASSVDRDRRVDSAAGADGFLVDGALRSTAGRRLVGAPARAAALETVRAIRARVGPDATIVAGGGVHAPQDALDVLAAGADLVSLDSGLVFAGPGLPKRVNEALEAVHGRAAEARVEVRARRAPEMSWFWTLALGVAMLAGSLLALAIAATRVVLPYDEHFVGLSRAELAAVNHRLLPFLTHDRVTLAGTMVAIGVLFTGLSWFGVRRGRHWAQMAIVVPSAAGFASFFLFLGFGYFDPFHAFVTAVLFQLLLLGVHGGLGPPQGLPPPMLVEDGAWRLGLWGQLGLVVQGIGFIGAGLVIAAIGATHVFVHEDLEFLATTARALASAGERIVPLVAHDRATLGGMLIASGLTILLTSLWGYRSGERWLWWTLLLAGVPGYAAAIGVHFAVGYESAFHLAPAFLGVGIFAAAMTAAYPTLCRH